MSVPNPNPSQSTPDQPTERKRRIDPRGIFVLLIMIAIAGYIIAIHHTPGLIKSTMNTTITKTNTSTILNGSIPGLQNFIAINFNLTNSMQGNQIIIGKNGEIYLQISGYFNQFPNSYPMSLNGKLFITYITVTVYNGSSTKSVILPVFMSVNYNKQPYFVYQVEGNFPQLQTLVSILKPNEFLGITFYTNTTIEIQGYAVW